MRSSGTALVVALALFGTGLVLAQSPEETPAARPTLPAALADRFGCDLPEVIWMGLHPTRNDGAWVLLEGQWTLVTGFAADARAEVKRARKRPAETPPVPPPDVGVTLHVVSFDRP